MHWLDSTDLYGKKEPEYRKKIKIRALSDTKEGIDEILRNEELVPVYALSHVVELRIISVYDIEDNL